jgi:hypothetical protein
MVSGGSAEPPFTILLGGKMARFVYRHIQEEVTKHIQLHKLTAQEIGEKIIKRPKGQTACEAADKIFDATDK